MLWAFFRKMHLHNLAGVPADRPVLLAVNHPTAFVDPIILCVHLEPPIYNMTRGDIFRKPFFRWFMRSINMFPVFRKRDGYTERDRNDEVFEFCHEKLRQRRVVTIYVEGEHHLEKRVRPLQKGIARIAFGAMQQHGLDDLAIIPIGVNYVHGDRPRDEAMVNVGPPIAVKPYFEAAQTAPGAALNSLLSEIHARLCDLCLHVENPDDGALAEQLLELHRSDQPVPALPPISRSAQRFLAEKAVLDRLNQSPEPEKNALRAQAADYFAALQQTGLRDFALRQPSLGSGSWLLFFALFFVPFAAGWLTSLPIARLARWVAERKVKKREFFGSVMLGVGFLSGLIYYLGILVACLLTGDALWISAGLLLPLLGWFSLIYAETWARWLAARRANRAPNRAHLLRLRAQLSDWLAGTNG